MTTISNSEVRISPFDTALCMWIEPGRAFASIQLRSMVWLPLLLTIGASVALLMWYFQSVDFAWLQDRMLAGVPDAGAREQARKIMTKGMMQTSALGGALLGVPLMYCVFAVYFLIVAKVKNLDVGFTKWFSFAVWASLPMLLTLPLGAMQILLAQNGQLDPNQLNPVSLNQLFFHIEMGRPWASLLDSINVTSVWTAVLLVVGFQQWSRLSRTTSVVIVAIPYAVIYAVWSVISLMSKAVV